MALSGTGLFCLSMQICVELKYTVGLNEHACKLYQLSSSNFLNHKDWKSILSLTKKGVPSFNTKLTAQSPKRKWNDLSDGLNSESSTNLTFLFTTVKMKFITVTIRKTQNFQAGLRLTGFP